MLNIAKIRKDWFTEQIEKLKKGGLSYAEIAASLDIKPQYLNLIKNTKRGASEKLTLKLCKTFNINHNDLLDRIRNYEREDTETRNRNEASAKILAYTKIPLRANASEIGGSSENASDEHSPGRTYEWIDAGNLFPEATSAIRHYDDSMSEYPPGSILILKRMVDARFIIWGRNYHVETSGTALTKRLQNGGEDYIIGYSSNQQTYPDGRLIHEPVKIAKKDIRRIYLILGCVIKEFAEGVIPATVRSV